MATPHVASDSMNGIVLYAAAITLQTMRPETMRPETMRPETMRPETMRPETMRQASWGQALQSDLTNAYR
ncbi:MAG: hypothetical protein CBB71_03460 [Rhodopirellula sp. TMED11]|nr:MAG: hypothetical protein CBB71_03460 [Rhodopirellula sp. TMED11]